MAVETGAVMEYDGSEPLERKNHEEFCHHFIRTRSIKEAGEAVGIPSRQNANVVHKRPDVQTRIKFLRQEILEELGLDTYYVLKGLKSVAERCMQGEQVTDRDGSPVFIQGPDEQYSALYKFEHAGANKALELIGKHVGMFSDKLEITGANGKDLVPPTFNIIGVKPNGDRE